MLRASATATDTPLDLRGLVDDAIDPLVPSGITLRAFSDAVLDRDRAAWGAARERLDDELGRGAAATAAGVAANFAMMNRLLDATGVPVPARRVAVGRELGIVRD